MKVNQSNWERIARAVLGIALLYIGFGGVVAGTLRTVIGIVGVIALLIGLGGWRSNYDVLKTARKKA